MTASGEPTGDGQAGIALETWVAQRLDTAVREITARGVYSSAVVEAKPAWVFPFTLLIGRIREQGQSEVFDWFICGDAPVSLASSKVATTPRDAARHFALQWQLQAARQGDEGAELAEKAGALYQLVEEDALWPEAV